MLLKGKGRKGEFDNRKSINLFNIYHCAKVCERILVENNDGNSVWNKETLDMEANV